ncbi:hypothetical protein D3C87_1565610 [compost metagenome]
MITTVKTKLASLFGRKKKSTLHAPRIAKIVLRWAIRRRSMAAYIAFLSWLPVLVSIMSFVYAVSSSPGPDTAMWIWRAKVWSAFALTLTFLIDSVSRGYFAWRRRR